jgi:hypothetical protein
MRRRALSLRSQDFPQVPADGTSAGPRDSPPIHLVLYFPDMPIRSQATVKVIRRHAGDRLDRKSEELLGRVTGATALEETGAAGKASHLRSRIAAIALTWLRA